MQPNPENPTHSGMKPQGNAPQSAHSKAYTKDSFSERVKKFFQANQAESLTPPSANSPMNDGAAQPPPSLFALPKQEGDEGRQENLAFDPLESNDNLNPENLNPENQTYLIYEQEKRRLQQYFGKENWQVLQPQLRQWGQSHLPDGLFQELSGHYDGVMLIFKMMQATQEPRLIEKGQNTIPIGQSEASLRQMMRDPRYWKSQDPAFRKKVMEGYRQLYPSA